MWGIFFGEFQCLPVDDCSAASCDSGVLTRGSESTSFYSAILVPPPVNFLMMAILTSMRLVKGNIMISRIKLINRSTLPNKSKILKEELSRNSGIKELGK